MKTLIQKMTMVAAVTGLVVLSGCQDEATYVEARLRANRKGQSGLGVHESMTLTNALFAPGMNSHGSGQVATSDPMSFTGETALQLPAEHHTPVKLDMTLYHYDLLSTNSDDMDVYAIQKSTGRKLDIGFDDRILIFGQPIYQEGENAVIKLDLWSMQSSSTVVREGETFTLKVDLFYPGTKEVRTSLNFDVNVIR
ncbi:MAG: hypothetical protein JNL01_05495 [Bdellovibrionales bacterium]|nr:hypothetical protein [Bdellovibrionales bacterium]